MSQSPEQPVAIQVDGDVDRALTFSFAELAALPDQLGDIATLLPGREGGAVRLRAVLAAVGMRPEATHLTLSSTDATFSASVPLDAVAEAVIAYRLGAAPLPAHHGGPARFYIPNVAQCALGGADACANVKFLGRIQVTKGAGQDTRPVTEEAHDDLHLHEREGR